MKALMLLAEKRREERCEQNTRKRAYGVRRGTKVTEERIVEEMDEAGYAMEKTDDYLTGRRIWSMKKEE